MDNDAPSVEEIQTNIDFLVAHGLAASAGTSDEGERLFFLTDAGKRFAVVFMGILVVGR